MGVMSFALGFRTQWSGMRRLFWVLSLIHLVLATGLAQGALPAKPPYTNPVTLQAALPGISLEAAVHALAKAAGVNLLARDLPQAQVAVQFKGLPFSRALDLLLRLYAPDHGAILLPEGLVVVAPKKALEGLLPKAPAKEEKPVQPPKGTKEEAQAYLVLDVSPLGEDPTPALKGLKVQTAYLQGLLTLSGNAEEVAQAAALVRELVRLVGERPKPTPPPLPQVPEIGVELLPIPQGLGGEALAKLLQVLELEGVPLPDLGFVIARGEKAKLAQAKSLLAAFPRVPKEANEERKPEPTFRAVLPLPEGLEAKAAAEALKGVYGEALSLYPMGEALVVAGPSSLVEEAKGLLGRMAPAPKPQREPVPLLTKAYPIYGDPADIAKGLGAILPPKELEALGARVEVLPNQKAVAVHAPYEVHRRVVEFLRSADPPKPQAGPKGQEPPKVRVQLTLQHLKPESVPAFLKSLGLEVEVAPSPDGRSIWLSGEKSAVDQAVVALGYADRNPPQARLRVQAIQVERSALNQLDPGVKLQLGGLELGLGGTGLKGGYTLPEPLATSLLLNLSALENRGLARTLLNTEALVLDGKPSKLISGGTLYVVQSSGNQGQGRETAQSVPGNIEYGLVVELNPRILLSPLAAEVQVKIELGSLPKAGPIANTLDVGKRSLETTLRLKSGETGLLGGLVYQELVNREGGVPLLKDLPLIGGLFRTQETGQKDQLLLLFVTPTAIEAPTQPLQELPPRLSPKEEAPSPNLPAEDPRTPPPPPVAKEVPAEAKPQADSPSPDPDRPLLPRAASWYEGQAYLTVRGLGAYVLGGETTPIATVVKAYIPTREGKLAEVSFQGYSEFGGGRIAVLTFSLPKSTIPQALYLVVRDELGGLWTVPLPVRAR